MQIQPKKSLGQNFLRDETVLEKIIESADLKADDFVIEIGPGEGVLTTKLARVLNRVVAIEKDEFLAERTAHNFQFPISNFQSISNNPILKFKNNAVIIIGDILQFDWVKIARANKITQYKVVANLPYYITSPIIRYFLENENQPSEMILMVQKEVAERITAEKGDMSILAVAVQYYASAEYLFTVPRTAFEPAPKVDSAVIKISSIAPSTLGRGWSAEGGSGEGVEDIKKFFQIVKAGFSAKRKTLANNLANGFHRDKKEVENVLEKQGFSKMVRAQELSVEDWKQIALYFSSHEEK